MIGNSNYPFFLRDVCIACDFLFDVQNTNRQPQLYQSILSPFSAWQLIYSICKDSDKTNYKKKFNFFYLHIHSRHAVSLVCPAYFFRFRFITVHHAWFPCQLCSGIHAECTVGYNFFTIG